MHLGQALQKAHLWGLLLPSFILACRWTVQKNVRLPQRLVLLGPVMRYLFIVHSKRYMLLGRGLAFGGFCACNTPPASSCGAFVCISLPGSSMCMHGAAHVNGQPASRQLLSGC